MNAAVVTAQAHNSGNQYGTHNLLGAPSAQFMLGNNNNPGECLPALPVLFHPSPKSNIKHVSFSSLLLLLLFLLVCCALISC